VSSLEDELAVAIAGAKKRIQFDPAWVWPPDRDHEKKFSHFVKRNASRWKLELRMSKVSPETVYEQTSFTEEGGSASQYLIFSGEETTWWFDGRRDDYSEFKNPSLRRKRVSRVISAVKEK